MGLFIVARGASARASATTFQTGCHHATVMAVPGMAYEAVGATDPDTDIARIGEPDTVCEAVRALGAERHVHPGSEQRPAAQRSSLADWLSLREDSDARKSQRTRRLPGPVPVPISSALSHGKPHKHSLAGSKDSLALPVRVAPILRVERR